MSENTNTVSRLDLAAIYETGRAGFVLDETDNPENEWFYAAFEGFKAVCDSLGENAREWDTLFHQSTFFSHGEWSKMLGEMRRYAGELKATERPQRHYTSDSRPDFKPESAKDIFNRQFKAKFPGKRINSKFANEKWTELAGKAQALALEIYHADLLEWERRESEREQRHAKLVAEWQKQIDGIAKVRAFVARLA